MGTGTFFSKMASYDPLAQALDLPGAHKWQQQQAENANSTNQAGPYAGVTPTLAAANAGYAPGGPGAQAGWQSQDTQPNPYVQAAMGAGAQPPNPNKIFRPQPGAPYGY